MKIKWTNDILHYWATLTIYKILQMHKGRTTGALASPVQDTFRYTLASNFPPGKSLPMFLLYGLIPAIKSHASG